MGSSRLPGKVLLDISGHPMLCRVADRVGKARALNDLVFATTTCSEDDAIAILCRDRGYHCFRGSERDVLDRYHSAAVAYGADVIVRLTADCPLLDPKVIDMTVAAFTGEDLDGNIASVQTLGNRTSARSSNSPYDYATNRLPPPWKRTFPIGLDTEVFSSEALEVAWTEAQASHQREHVTPYFYDLEDRFRAILVDSVVDHGSLRWTVDTKEDLELIRALYSRIGQRPDFGWQDVLKMCQREPELLSINAGVRQKRVDEIDSRTGDGLSGAPSG